MTDRAQPGAIGSVSHVDELAQVFGQFSDGWIVDGDDPTPGAKRRSDVDETALEAFDISYSSGSLNVDIKPGEAFVSGWCIRDTTTTLSLDRSTTTDIVVGWNFGASYDPNNDPDRDAADKTIVDIAANVVTETPTTLIWRVETDQSGVTDVYDMRDIGPTVSATEAEVANRPVAEQLFRHTVGIGELRFNVGLSKLDYESGFFDILEDQSDVASTTDVSGFSGSVTVNSSPDFGSFTSTVQSLSFTPSSVVVGHTATQQSGPQVAQNSESFDYTVLSAETVSDATLTLTGRDATGSNSAAKSGMADGDSISFTVGGSKPVNMDVTFSGSGASLISPQVSKDSSPSSFHNEADMSDDTTVGLLGTGGDNGFVVDTSDPSNPTVYQVNDPGNQVTAVALNSDGTVGLLGSNDDTAYVLDLSDLSNIGVAQITTPGDDVKSCSLSDDGTVGFIGSFDNTAYVLDTSDPSNPSVDASITDPGSEVYETELSDDGTVGLISDDNGSAFAVDLSTTTNPTTNAIGGSRTRSRTASLSGDGSVALVCHTSGSSVDVVDLSNLSSPSVATVSDPSASPEAAVINNDGTLGLVGADDTDGYVIDASDPANPSLYATITDPGDKVNAAALSADGTGGVLGSNDNSAYTVDLATPSNPTVTEVTDPASSVFAAAMGGPSDVAVIGDIDGNIFTFDMGGSVTDPSITIDGKTASHTGTLTTDQSVTKTLTDITTGSYTESVSLSDGELELTLSWTETTETKDPDVEIDPTGGSTQTVSFTGTIADGDTEDLSSQVDASQIDGDVTVTVTVSDTVSGPTGEVVLDYSHSGFNVGGLVKYEFTDGDGNTVVVEADEEVSIPATSSDQTVKAVLQDGLATVELFDYAVYYDQ